MSSLPTADTRSNLASWAVPACKLPCVVQAMLASLPPEQYDPSFQGQCLKTFYLDTQKLLLYKARCQQDQYLTLRLRYYPNDVYALSAKTESEKFRVEVDPQDAQELLAQPDLWLSNLLPANLLVRLQSITQGDSLLQAVHIHCTRFARENRQDRLTLDVDIHTSRGKCLPFGVLEWKSTDPSETDPPGSLGSLCLSPLKISKFKWSLEV